MISHEVFIHIDQGCFAGTGAIVRLPQCQRSKPGGYGKISQCITTTKHSKAKTVCIFLGIYCNSVSISMSWRRLWASYQIRHRLQRKPLVNGPGLHHDTCVTHVPWCMSGSLTRGGGENVTGIPGACVTRKFTYLTRGPWGTIASP